MDNEKKSIFQKFNELTILKKASVCLGVLIVLMLLTFIVSISFFGIEEYNPTEVQALCDQYDSYDIYVTQFYAWANSIHAGDSEPANLTEVLKDDAKDVVLDMHEGGMSVKEIAHALNEPVRLAYEEGIVDSPTLYDESFVNEVLDKNL